IELRSTEDQLVLEVRDNGRGVTHEELNARDALGLLGMRERAHACNGTIEFQGSPGHGTTGIMRIPLDPGTREWTNEIWGPTTIRWCDSGFAISSWRSFRRSR